MARPRRQRELFAPPAERESPILARILKVLQAHPHVVAERMQAGAGRRRGYRLRLGREGAPDIVCAVRGAAGYPPIAIWLEVKRDDRRSDTSPEQDRYHALYRDRTGGSVVVVRSEREAPEAIEAVQHESRLRLRQLPKPRPGSCGDVLDDGRPDAHGGVTLF